MFSAGAVIGQAILDATGWTKGAKQVQQSSQGLNKGFSILSKAVAGASVAIAAAIGKSVVEANKFNKEFANVSTLVDPAIVDLKSMKNELLGLDSRLGSSRELTEGLYQAISASVEPTKAVEFVGEAAQFARAALVDTNTAVDVITTGLNAYGLEAGEAGRISDVLFTTIKNGKVTGEELSGTIGQVIPLAANMGLSFENLGTSIAEMTKQGINSANATTQLNSVMTALLRPSESLSEAMEKAGFETGEAVTSSDNFQEALQQIIAQTDGSQEALAELFPNVRALRGALALTGEGASGFADTLSEMENASGATTEAFEKQEITFETLNNSINKLFVLIGERFLPVVLQSTGSIIALIDELTTSGDAFDKLTDAISIGQAVFETIKDIVQDIVDSAFQAFQEEVGDITDKLEELKGPGDDTNAIFQAIAFASNMLAQGVRITVKTFSSLIQIAVDVIQAGKDIVNIFGTVWEVIKGEKDLDDIKDSFFNAGESFKTLGQTIVGESKDLVDEYANSIQEILDKQQETAKELQINAVTAAKETKEAIVGTAASAVQAETRKTEIIIGLQDQVTQNQIENNAALVDDTKVTTETSLTLWEQFYDQLVIKGKSSTEELKKQFAAFKTAAGAIYSGLTGVVNQFFQNEVDRAEEGSDAQKEAKRKQFIATKAFAIAEATINTITAATKALTAGPFIGPIMAGIITALGIAQVGLIAAQPMPQFQFGTDGEGFQAPGNEDFIAAFQRNEVVTVEDENDVAEGGTGDQMIVIQNVWDDKVVGENMFRLTRNGLAKIANRALVSA